MAGVPKITQGMLRGLDGKLAGGKPVQSRAVGAWAQESAVADLLREVQDGHEGVQVGSYPFWREGKGGANFVLRSTDEARLAQAVEALKAGLEAQGIAAQEGEILSLIHI